MTEQRRPWLVPGLSPEQRVDLLLPLLTLREQVGQLVQAPNLSARVPDDRAALAAGAVGSTLLASGALAGAVRDEGVDGDGIAAVRDLAARSRLGIPLLVARDVIHGHRSVHPIPLAVAAAFDEALTEELAEQAAAEAAADGVDWVFAPMLDLAEDPRWGRVAESFGESPLVAGRLGAASVRGFQRSGRVAACAKHFVGYGLSRGGRDYAAVDVGEVGLRNRHLRPFRDAVQEGCRTVMAAFSAVDGVPMHAHRHLLRGVLKGEWGFDGVIVADWDGIGELMQHGVAADLREAARLAIEAGVDVDMVSGAYAAHLEPLVRDGVVDPALVMDAARRVLLLKARLGLLDGAERSAAEPVDRERGRALAVRAARAAIVLAAWDGLPPVPEAGTVHLTGPLADDSAAQLGTWVLDGDPADAVTPAAALRRRYGERLLVDDGRSADLAVSAAREAAVTVAVVGEHPGRSGEDAAVSDLRLPAGQLELLRALRRTAARLVVVVVAGRPLALEPLLDLADVLLLTGHPGISGDGVAAAVAGEGAGGRLPATWPAGTGTVPWTADEAPTGRPLPGGTRYRDRRQGPRLPFGAGSGWSTFEVGAPVADAATIAVDGSVRVRVPVRNTGGRDDRHLVLLEARDPVADVTRPVRDLIDWAWVALPAGASGDAVFDLPAAAFAYAGRDGRARVDTGEVHVLVGAHRLVLQVVP